jgi:hypothetical protein
MFVVPVGCHLFIHVRALFILFWFFSCIIYSNAWRARLAFRGKKTASEVIKCREEQKKGKTRLYCQCILKKKHNYIFTPLNKSINQAKTNNMNFPCQIHQQGNSLTPSLNINLFNKMIAKQ